MEYKSIVEFKNIVQKYPGKEGEFVLFDGLSLNIEDKHEQGEFVIFMGESGCGKSTLLRYLTNIQKPTSGEIYLRGELLKPTDIIPMVFQMPSSLEWFTVLENVMLPLTLKGVDKKEAEHKAMEMIKIVGLDGHEKKFCKYPLLSGGQLQRVAVARSLVANPGFLLMDEPFSALDSVNRRKMQEKLKDILEFGNKAGIYPTIILVTHDAREAAYLGNDIYIMASKPGRIKEHIKVGFGNDRDVKKTKTYLDLVEYIENTIG